MQNFTIQNLQIILKVFSFYTLTFTLILTVSAILFSTMYNYKVNQKRQRISRASRDTSYLL